MSRDFIELYDDGGYRYIVNMVCSALAFGVPAAMRGS